MQASVLALLVALAPTLAIACAENQVDIRAGGVEARFKVDVADEPAEQAQGLMFVESMPKFTGMLFVNEQPERATFWMKNTLIPLDMLFIDETGTVKTMHENAEPLSEEVINGGDGILAILEINGGLARQLGFGPGSEIRHPAFDQAIAAWPCGAE